ncbi:MAG: CoA ester lyase [Candidatus Rokubacteria bacterium]|nr:CoA ester lyase [Candidatus Rokubacteria bacterium]
MGTVALRSLLFAPGNEPRKVSKVATFGADAIILDLEDAVPDAEKLATRPLVRAALAELRGPLVCVRINAFRTGLAPGDVDAVVAQGLDAIVLPKAETAEEISVLEMLLAAAELREGLPAGHVRILPIVETARGLLNASAVAAASPRVLTLAFGSGDFTRDLELPSIRWSLEGAELFYARAKLVVDARAAGRPRPLDGPYVAVRDAKGFEEDCRTARRLGFQGKICIHPLQVAAANRIFAPDPDEVAFCRRVVEAFKTAEARGSASITVDGIFVDYPIVEKAERIIRLADMLAAKDRSAAGSAATLERSGR